MSFMLSEPFEIDLRVGDGIGDNGFPFPWLFFESAKRELELEFDEDWSIYKFFFESE